MSLRVPEPATADVHAIPRRYVVLGLVVVAIILLGGLVLIRNNSGNNTPTDAETFSAAPSSLVQSLAQVPTSVSDAVGAGDADGGPSVAAPSATNNASLWVASDPSGTTLPVVFFYGAEFAPYAAAERWPVLVALSRFGTFTNLGLMQSSSSVAFPGVATFTFSHATYRSRWISFQAVERYSDQDTTGAGYSTLDALSPRQAASVSVYDSSSTSFPLLDIANHFTLSGSSFSPSVLAGLSQAQIASDLAYADSPVTQAIVASANEVTAAICAVTGQSPAAACDTRGVLAADTKMGLQKAG